MNDDFKSFYLAIILSACVVLAVNYLMPKQPAAETEEVAEIQPETALQVAETEDTDTATEEVAAVIFQDARLPIANQVIEGSIRLKGTRFDYLQLLKYKQTVEEDSPQVELFRPAKTELPHFAEFGWLSSDTSLLLPNSNTLWKITGNQKLTPNTPITLEWQSPQGLRFTNQISLDENYLFTIKQTVENNSDKPITLLPYGLLSKTIDTGSSTRGVVHEGFTGIIDNDLQEIKYANISPEGEKFTSRGGWASFNDKYWFSAIIFDDSAQSKINLRQIKEGVYQLDYKGQPIPVAVGSSASVSTRMYAGAKEIKLLDKYEKDIAKFDLNVDFGWYYFLTKPFFYILDFLYGFIGNMGWAILLFAAFLRLLMFPIANKSYDSMSKMKKVQPKIMALQEIYKDDKMALQRATMELYKKEKVNPASGCLPLFIQIPIFFSLYKVLNIAIEIRHAPFIGWVKDLSAPDPLTISTWAHIYVPSMLDIGIWPLIYGLTMFLQNQLNPKPANKDQARMFALMPIIFTIMFAHFAVGLVIYWILNNVLSLLQQKVIMYKNGVK